MVPNLNEMAPCSASVFAVVSAFFYLQLVWWTTALADAAVILVAVGAARGPLAAPTVLVVGTEIAFVAGRTRNVSTNSSVK